MTPIILTALYLTCAFLASRYFYRRIQATTEPRYKDLTPGADSGLSMIFGTIWPISLPLYLISHAVRYNNNPK